MNLSDKHIAIIGGMGPQASALLHAKIVDGVTSAGVRDCHEFPLISHISLPVRDFISDPEVRHESTAAVKRSLSVLMHKPIDALIVACNTAHLLMDELPEFSSQPLISLPDAILTQAKSAGVRKLGLLASPTTIESRLFQRHAAGEIEIIVPDAVAQKQLENLIRRTIAGRNNEDDPALILSLADDLIAMGAQKVALGCTELSVAVKDKKDDRLIDSLDAATEALLSSLKPIRQKASL